MPRTIPWSNLLSSVPLSRDGQKNSVVMWCIMQPAYQPIASLEATVLFT